MSDRKTGYLVSIPLAAFSVGTPKYKVSLCSGHCSASDLSDLMAFESSWIKKNTETRFTLGLRAVRCLRCQKRVGSGNETGCNTRQDKTRQDIYYQNITCRISWHNNAHMRIWGITMHTCAFGAVFSRWRIGHARKRKIIFLALAFEVCSRHRPKICEHFYCFNTRALLVTFFQSTVVTHTVRVCSV